MYILVIHLNLYYQNILNVMQSTYLHIFDDIQNEIVSLINKKNTEYLSNYN